MNQHSVAFLASSLWLQGAEPAQQLLAHLRAAEQGHMTGAIDDQGMGGQKGQLMARLAVLAEGAAQGHQSIANQPVGQQAALGGSGRGDGIAVDAAGEGKRLAGIPHGHGGISITLPWRRSLIPVLRNRVSLTKGSV